MPPDDGPATFFAVIMAEIIRNMSENIKSFIFTVKKRSNWPTILSNKGKNDSLFVRTFGSCISVERGSGNRDDNWYVLVLNQVRMTV